MSRIWSRARRCLDAATTVVLVGSVALLLLLYADLLASPTDAVRSHPGYLSALANAMLFLALLSMPTLCCAIAWPIHLRQKRRGEKVFGWLRYAVLASSVWMWLVYKGITSL